MQAVIFLIGVDTFELYRGQMAVKTSLCKKSCFLLRHYSKLKLKKQHYSVDKQQVASPIFSKLKLKKQHYSVDKQQVASPIFSKLKLKNNTIV